MVRRIEDGHTKDWQTRAARLLRWAAIATLSIGATSAGAAEVAEVRVGTHEKSTRIVLELDEASGYQLVTPTDGKPELTIHLDAKSIARDVPSKSPVVRKVRVEPTANGSTVQIRLATPNVAVKELLLANPPRLVFDLTALGPIPKLPVEEEVAETPAEPTAPAVVADAAPAPAKLDPPVAKPADAEPIVVAAAEAAPSEPAPAPAEPAASAPPVQDAKPEMPPAPTTPAAEVMPPPSAPVVTPPAREASPPPAPAPQSSSADARRKAITAKVQPPAESESILSLVLSPMGLGAIGAGALLVGAIIVMRRRRASEDEDPLYTVMSADDAGDFAPIGEEREEPVRAAPIWEPDAFEASEPAPKLGAHQFTFGARPEPEPAPEPEPVEPPDDVDSDSIFASASAPIALGEPEPLVAAPSASPFAAAMPDEMEHRIAEMERRIEQLTEARERLERQVAAQTEELRVQRAAIARTQRVVRSIAKTEDMATEPVPRAPSVS